MNMHIEKNPICAQCRNFLCRFKFIFFGEVQQPRLICKDITVTYNPRG